jgi:transposase InsO family protein
LILHANAVLSHRQRERLVNLVSAGMTITAAAALVGCSRQTGSKWVGRHRRGEGLTDRSSRPHHSPGRTPAAVERLVLETRARLRKGPHPLGWKLGLAPSTVHAILKRHGRSILKERTSEPVVRYERTRPGELIHIDIKKLGRIQRRRDPVSGRPVGTKGRAGWDYLFVCVDDHTRLAHAALYPDETTRSALAFLTDCQRFYQQHAIQIDEVLTDNGKCFHRQWETGSRDLQITPRHTRVRRPQTNGKAERFIQTLLNEWIRPHTYTNNTQRTETLPRYLNFYNHHRRHRSLNGQTPAQRASTTSPGHTTRFRCAATWFEGQKVRRSFWLLLTDAPTSPVCAAPCEPGQARWVPCGSSDETAPRPDSGSLSHGVGSTWIAAHERHRALPYCRARRPLATCFGRRPSAPAGRRSGRGDARAHRSGRTGVRTGPARERRPESAPSCRGR